MSATPQAVVIPKKYYYHEVAYVRLLEAALRKIAKMKSEPIGDTGFSVGPAQLFANCQRIAKKALAGKED